MSKMKLFAVAPPGLEWMVLEDCAAAGIPGARIEEGGVGFEGDDSLLFRANMHLRVASRVLVRMARFHASEFHELERRVRRIPWEKYVGSAKGVSLRVTARKSKLYHSGAISERVASAIERSTGRTVSDEDDSQLIVVRFVRDECVISADSSGAHLHMRGYRQATARAPLRETLAAALVHAANWRGESPLLDPMCGAGTIPIEAALIAARIAPGIACAARAPRAHAFERWPGFRRGLWDEIVAAAQAAIDGNTSVAILASDRDQGAIEATLSNADRAGVGQMLQVSCRAVSAVAVDVAPDDVRGVVICNPPYGKRVGEEKGLRDLYAAFGAVMRERFADWDVVMLSGNSALDRHTRLDLRSVAHTTNGGIPVQILKGRVQLSTVARTRRAQP